MDSASPHVSERVLQLLGCNKIMVIAFPTHTENIFQTLDLSFWCPEKDQTDGGWGI
jgi:hypothetical protein